jgi:hypothetical protein
MPEIVNANTPRQTTAPELLAGLFKAGCTVVRHRRGHLYIVAPSGRVPTPQLSADIARCEGEILDLLTGAGAPSPCSACGEDSPHGFLHIRCLDALLKGTI